MNTSTELQDHSEASYDRSLFASLKVPDYLYLWIGMVGSAFAMNMQIVAQGWLVYEMSASAVDLAWVTLASIVPQFLFSLPGGVLADHIFRYSKQLGCSAKLICWHCRVEIHRQVQTPLVESVL